MRPFAKIACDFSTAARGTGLACRTFYRHHHGGGSNADLLACADIEEGAALRAAGVKAEILVFGALSVSDLDGLFDSRLTPTISTPGAARAVQAAAARYRQRLAYHLKIDTGMNRLGFRFDNLRRTLPALLASENLQLDAVYTHFATADSPESSLFDTQRRRFEHALTEIKEIGGHPRYRHAANSAGMLRDSRVWFDRVRPGLLLYGIVPPPLASTIALTPVMALTSRVVAVKGLRPGEITGYGGHFTAAHPTTIAIVPAGYADGLDYRLAGRGCAFGLREARQRSPPADSRTIGIGAPPDAMVRVLCWTAPSPS